MKTKRMIGAVVIALTLLVSVGPPTPAYASGWEHDSGRSRAGWRAPERIQSLPHGPGVDEVVRPRDPVN